jgi:hypothetical protein
MIENRSVQHNKINYHLEYLFSSKANIRRHQTPQLAAFGGFPPASQPSKPCHATDFQVFPYLPVIIKNQLSTQ